MRTMRGVAIATLMIACGAFAVDRRGPEATRPGLSYDQDADSTRLRGTWTAVRDVRGQAVAAYAWTLQRNGAVVDSGTVNTTAVQRAFANPAAGDSAMYALSVVAIDVRGVRSAPGRSPILVVRAPWLAPPAPVVGIDTLAAAPLPSPVDSISTVVVMEDGTVTQDPVFRRVGETAQSCVIEWVGRAPRLPAGQAIECNAVGALLEQYFPASPLRST